MICDYGCGQEAKYNFKNGKNCCNITCNSCPKFREKISISKKEEKNPNFGKIFTAETIEKMRRSHLGQKRKFSKEHKLKLSKARKDKTFSKRPNHSEFMRKNNPAKRLDVRNKLKGHNNPNWKGGISTNPYCEIFNQKDFRDIIFIRDAYTCQNCGITKMLSLKVYSKELSLHHINYNKQECKLKNVITVCCSCNSKANFNRDEWEKYFTYIIEEKEKDHGKMYSFKRRLQLLEYS